MGEVKSLCERLGLAYSVLDGDVESFRFVPMPPAPIDMVLREISSISIQLLNLYRTAYNKLAELPGGTLLDFSSGDGRLRRMALIQFYKNDEETGETYESETEDPKDIIEFAEAFHVVPLTLEQALEESAKAKRYLEQKLQELNLKEETLKTRGARELDDDEFLLELEQIEEERSGLKESVETYSQREISQLEKICNGDLIPDMHLSPYTLAFFVERFQDETFQVTFMIQKTDLNNWLKYQLDLTGVPMVSATLLRRSDWAERRPCMADLEILTEAASRILPWAQEVLAA